MKKLKIYLLLFIFFSMACNDRNATFPAKFPVVISTKTFPEYATEDEWIHLKIERSDSEIVYDSSAVVTLEAGFSDTLMLGVGDYKCFIIDMGANVFMPEITLRGEELVDWTNSENGAYPFSVP